MSKNIVVVVGSPRENGNTEILADAFIKGAKSNDNTVTKINLSKLKISDCVDCKYCSTHNGECAQKDGMDEVYPELRKADMVVFASPVYFYGFTAQMKAVIDRLNVTFSNNFPITSCALLTVYEDTNTTVPDPMIAHYKAFTGLLRWEDKGIIAVSGVGAKGAINSHDSLVQAEQLGTSI